MLLEPVSLDSSSDMELAIRTGELIALNHFIQADTIDGSALILAHVSGTPYSLTLAATVDADSNSV